MVTFDQAVDDFAIDLESGKCHLLVLAHKPAKSDYIGGKDSGKPAFDALRSHRIFSRRDTGNGINLRPAAVGVYESRLAMSAKGQTRKSVTATRMSAFGGKAEVDFGRLDVSL